MRITTKAGINNAFWLTGKDLEIDIAEAHFPKDIHCTLHDWHKPPRIIRRILYQDHLADTMNDYGLLWLPDRLIWTFNGKAMFTVETQVATTPAEVRFSTAVADLPEWGKTDDPTGTEMDVYWVHVAPLKEDLKQP
jgi:beta-glucanase (GH16 family)